MTKKEKARKRKKEKKPGGRGKKRSGTDKHPDITLTYEEACQKREKIMEKTKKQLK